MRTDQNNIHKVGMVNHTSPQELCRVLAKETNNNKSRKTHLLLLLLLLLFLHFLLLVI